MAVIVPLNQTSAVSLLINHDFVFHSSTISILVEEHANYRVEGLGHTKLFETVSERHD